MLWAMAPAVGGGARISYLPVLAQRERNALPA